MDERHGQGPRGYEILRDGPSLWPEVSVVRKCRGAPAGMKGQDGKSWEVRLSRQVRVPDQVKARPRKETGLFSAGMRSPWKCLSRKGEGQGEVWGHRPPAG